MARGKAGGFRVDLGPRDAACIVRANGNPKLVIPTVNGELLPENQVLLTSFALSIYDERLRDLLAQLMKEKQDAAR